MDEKANLQEQMDALKNDFGSLRRDIADLAKTLRDSGASKAEGIKASIDEELHAKAEELKRAWEYAREHGQKAKQELEAGVGAHPYTTILAAFGVGFIIAKLIDRGRRD